LAEGLEDLRWRGPRSEALARLADALEDPQIASRADELAARAR
jgi:hypothetical protein